MGMPVNHVQFEGFVMAMAVSRLGKGEEEKEETIIMAPPLSLHSCYLLLINGGIDD